MFECFADATRQREGIAPPDDRPRELDLVTAAAKRSGRALVLVERARKLTGRHCDVSAQTTHLISIGVLVDTLGSIDVCQDLACPQRSVAKKSQDQLPELVDR